MARKKKIKRSKTTKVNFEPKHPLRLGFRWSIRHPVGVSGFRTKKQAISFAKKRRLKATIQKTKKGTYEVFN